MNPTFCFFAMVALDAAVAENLLNNIYYTGTHNTEYGKFTVAKVVN